LRERDWTKANFIPGRRRKLRLAKTYCDAPLPAGMKPREYTLDHGKAPDHSGAIQLYLEKTHGFTVACGDA